MPLAAGTGLGPYEIVAPIGKGGMGEVWKAGDGQNDPRKFNKKPEEFFG